MDAEQLHRRRAERARERRRRAMRRRVAAIVALVAAIAAVVVAATSLAGGSSPTPRPAAGAGHAAAHPRTAGGHAASATGSTTAPRGGRGASTASVLGPATGHPGTATVPVLMYHVIAPPPSGAPYPGLYVTPQEFAAQMQALQTSGWRAVTLDQLRAYWTDGARLPAGKPMVITFDNGYHSQYTQALPVLRRMGWVGDENIQLSGLPPSQGGMTHAEVKALVDAGWELDTQGISHADLATADPAELRYQVVRARQILRREYGVPVNWFCYPSGQYNAAVISQVRAAGFVGSTTVVPGWAASAMNPYTLPRLRVLGGTSPAALLGQIASTRAASSPPSSYVTS